jgi:ankyrin repeat protein
MFSNLKFFILLNFTLAIPVILSGQENFCDSLLESTYNGNYLRTKNLLKQRAKPDCFSEEGITPLLYAIDRHDLKLAQLLLENGALINLKALDSKGESPLILSVKKGFADIALYLLEKGADVNGTDYLGNTSLHYAAFYNDSLMAEILLSHGADANITGNDGLTPLMHAAYNGCNEVIPVLIQNGAIANKPDNIGFTALMYAAQNSKYQTAEILIQNWANCRVRSKDGRTAFSIAITQNDTALVNLFVNSGANVNEKYSNSLQPLSLSRIYASKIIQDTIKGWGGKSNLFPDFSGSRGFGLINRFNNKEWQLGAKLLFRDIKFNFEVSAYFAFRTSAIPVLVQYYDSYFQFRERKNILGGSLGKSFLIDRKNGASYLFCEALCEYQFGKYRGTKISINDGFYIKPSVGYEYISNWFISRLSGYYSDEAVKGNAKWGIELDLMFHFRKHTSEIHYMPLE